MLIVERKASYDLGFGFGAWDFGFRVLGCLRGLGLRVQGLGFLGS